MKIIKKIFVFAIIILITFSLTLPCFSAANNKTDQTILLDIPFTVQAPLANWRDPKQQDACEEASALMAIYWVKNKKLPAPKLVEKEILAISDYEQKKYNNYQDTSAEDTVKRIFNDYYQYKKVEAKFIKSTDEIINELKLGNAVIVPVNGQKLKNPYYTRPGPERHMLLIKGYDFQTKEFITNDTGTRRGKNYRYPAKILEQALRDYLTGNKLPIKQTKKAMIVIRPK